MKTIKTWMWKLNTKESPNWDKIVSELQELEQKH